MERVRAHLARAGNELKAAARRFLNLNPRMTDEAETVDLVRTVANARKSVCDALETLRTILEGLA